MLKEIDFASPETLENVYKYRTIEENSKVQESMEVAKEFRELK